MPKKKQKIEIIGTNIPIKDNSYAPDGREAVNPDVMKANVIKAMEREESAINIGELMQKLSGQQTFEQPLLIDIQNGTPIIKKVEIIKDSTNDNYMMVVPKYERNVEDVKQKKRLVKKLMKTIDKDLRKEIGVATEVALMRRPIEKIKKLLGNSKKQKASLRNRVGCLYLEIGDEDVLI